MEDFEEKLNSILSSPETMGQIMALANTLSGQPSGDTAQASAEPSLDANPHNTNADTPPIQTASADASNHSDSPLELLQGLDPQMLQRILALWREYTQGGDEKAALLQAMRPFLKEERRSKLDKAVKITRLSRIIRSAMQQFKGGEGV